MTPIAEFLTENYKKRSMGLVCDNSPEIRRVYTAVFPSNDVMQSILDKGEKEVMLFVHHPSVWDITLGGFQQMDRSLLEKFKECEISVYNLHVPLDNYGSYSTSVTLAKAMGLTELRPFLEYYGSLAAVFGNTESTTVQEMSERFTAVIGHGTSLYQYGTDRIKNGIVAVAAGGGNIVEVHEEIAREGINLLITGITVKNPFTMKAHDFAKEKRINILGGTHYTTEKPACQAMCNYFRKLGLPSEFIAGTPGLEDL
ncbi:MAG: hypothetical protein A2Z29_11360 [Chloroflexi bacterium RBG_16_56_11]|nr:MAG: hypothetical protein A2Z29_11360 [Chloroflexi bacterium RBG_16_56_11]